jgi:hypothetical protein
LVELVYVFLPLRLLLVELGQMLLPVRLLGRARMDVAAVRLGTAPDPA